MKIKNIVFTLLCLICAQTILCERYCLDDKKIAAVAIQLKQITRRMVETIDLSLYKETLFIAKLRYNMYEADYIGFETKDDVRAIQNLAKYEEGSVLWFYLDNQDKKFNFDQLTEVHKIGCNPSKQEGK